MFPKFQVDWSSTSSKTTSSKNFNLKRDRRTDGRTDEQTNVRTNEQTDAQTRPENIMPINGAYKIYLLPWVIKKIIKVYDFNSI